MLSANLFNSVFVIPILNLLIVLYKFFLAARIPGAFGLSIIGLTTLIRLAFNPFFQKQLETAKKMQTLKPKLDKLSKKHKKNSKKLQQEQVKLYQKEGINPASGCVFMIIQIPVFIGLYKTLALFLVDKNIDKIIIEINKVLYAPWLKISTINSWFIGLNLALSPKLSGSWVYYSVPLITAFFQYWQVKLSSPPQIPESEKQKKSDKSFQKDSQGDFQKAMNTQMKFVFPIMIGYFSYTLPIGLSLYWNIFSIFSIIQYQKLNSKS